MALPPDPDLVAWWSLGYGMGGPGNVVLAGHVDYGGRLRVFGQLSHLWPGAAVMVTDELGREYRYTVEAAYWVAAEGAAVDEIFAAREYPVLTLITCGGPFDRSTGEYLERLIVRARLD